MSTPKRCYGWCYSVHRIPNSNPTNYFLDKLKTIDCRYHIIGIEKDKCGCDLFIGFIYFKNRKSWKGIRNLLMLYDVEPQKWLTSVCVNFCKRSDSFWEKGKQPNDKYNKVIQARINAAICNPSLMPSLNQRVVPSCDYLMHQDLKNEELSQKK